MNIDFRTTTRTDPTVTQGFRTTYPPGKRVFPRWRWTAILVLALSPLLLFVASKLKSFLLVEGRGVLVSRTLEVSHPVDGWLDTVFVRQGDLVDSGAPLASWRSRETDGDGDASFAADFARAGIPNLEERIRIARTSVELLVRRENAIAEIEAQGAATSTELATARLATLEARGVLAALRRERSLASVRPLRGNGRGSEAPHVLRATSRGRILSTLRPSERIPAGRAAVTMRPEPQAWSASGWFSPRFLDLVDEGRAITVTLPDGERLAARIESIVPIADSSDSDRRFRDDWDGRFLVVEVRLTDSLPDRAKVEGLPVDLDFWRFAP